MRVLIVFFFFSSWSFSQSFHPEAGVVGTNAIHKDSNVFIAWATTVELTRGFLDISDTNFTISGNKYASFGVPANALGPAEGNSSDIVSLGDKGEIVLGFASPIINGPTYDFAIFENSFSPTYLELAHVEVSTDGINYVRFNSVSETSISLQVGPFTALDPTYINNLAGKYQQGYGVPFDLNELAGNPLIDLNNINFIKIIDAVGSIDPNYGTLDSQGNSINDPFPTPFESCGFDLDAVGVIHNQEEVLKIKEYQNSLLNIFPNPSNGFFQIQFIGESKGVLEIFSITGQRVYRQNIVENTQELQLHIDLVPGQYLLKHLNENGVLTKRVVIQ